MKKKVVCNVLLLDDQAGVVAGHSTVLNEIDSFEIRIHVAKNCDQAEVIAERFRESTRTVSTIENVLLLAIVDQDLNSASKRGNHSSKWIHPRTVKREGIVFAEWLIEEIMPNGAVVIWTEHAKTVNDCGFEAGVIGVKAYIAKSSADPHVLRPKFEQFISEAVERYYLNVEQKQSRIFTRHFA
jgi:DNA-binding NarL/FixJ family response regulator